MNGASLIHLLFLIVALVCFFLAFLRRFEAVPGVSIGWLGFCFWMLDMIIFGAIK
jgi:hypothetical protein